MKYRNKQALIVIALLLGLLLVLQTPLLASMRATAWSWWVGVQARVFNVDGLDMTDDALAQVAELRSKNVRLQAQEAQYQKIIRQLGESSFEDYRKVPALVTKSVANPFASEVILNRGIRDGVVEGLAVTVNGSQLYGVIVKVAEDSATCRLVTHPQFALPVEVIDKDSDKNSAGLLEGRRHTALAVTRVPHDIELVANRELVTSLHGNIPVGLLVGEVEEVTESSQAAYQEGWVRLPYEPRHVEFVNVIVLP